ncbi:hypothetical protein [Wenjunlia tyrosinilytica]|uniref:hypothetical protein n=1 Tax=Wenjunlia tyrosinilytica TaxID=1544741 RepID=UPI001E48375A|nr:hypothetical protein [Wenjunlia tyrosinilytica]
MRAARLRAVSAEGHFSAMPLAGKDNGAAGALLSSFYGKTRIVDGKDNDAFIVIIK